MNQEYKLIEKKLKFELKKKGESLIIDNEFKKMFDLLFLYFTKNKKFTNSYFEVEKGKIAYTHSKGLLVLGTTGRGKSLLFERVFYDYLKYKKSSREYKRTTSNKIEDFFIEHGIKGFSVFKKIYPGYLYIDELGVEETELNDYGTKYKPMIKILNYRYQQFIKFNTKTYATTNLTLPELKSKYGQRIFSRIYEMFNIISTHGNDFRLKLI